MRASRVEHVPSSIFRNSRQYLHSNELFHRVMDEGGGNHQGNPQQQNNNRQPNKRKGNSRVVLNRTSKGTVIKGLLIDCNEILQIQNKLIKHAAKISAARNRINITKSYRSSI